ncbi:MAG TPA: TadE/TadG family type IV pilus assembly protein [Pseudolabrys sp.]|jgi:Flp pilus assembly protein TadG|nr:TadE/TadG family type IV pilus assembly protein [Pseudolabrys sp.]
MTNFPRSRAARRMLAMLPVRFARRFARRQDGAAAVEFALVALPFLALTFAIIETALVFFAGQTLEAAVAESARLIMTGQAQNANYTAADFKTQVCNRIAGLFDCNGGVYVDVKSYSTFGAISSAQPVTNNQFDASKVGYSLAGPGCIQVVSLYYQWPIYVSLLGDNLSTLNGNYRLLAATAVFKNEPYSTTGGC